MNRAFDYAEAIENARRTWRTASLSVLDGWAWFLSGKAGNCTSQNGEDGIIAALFEKIGTRNRWCFEVGTADGLYLSNVWALRQDGWSSLLIEADGVAYAKLAASKPTPGRTVLVNECIGTKGRLDDLLTFANAPTDLDLGIIDVDGIDAALWRGLKRFRPRVLMIEFNPTGDGVLGGTTIWQAGLPTVEQVGAEKGYRLVARTYHNAFFVDEDAIKETS